MDGMMVCPECRREHDEPGEATLGLHVRCIDCACELEAFLAAAHSHVVVPPAERPAA